MLRSIYIACCVLGFSFLMLSCNKNDDVTEKPSSSSGGTALSISGSGNYVFDDYEPLADKPINIYYNIPEKADSKSPILIVFHGNGRDAMESRDAMISSSNSKGYILIVPEFSKQYFNTNAYHLGNVFRDGENPSASTLNDEAEWTFSMIDPLFENVKKRTGSEVEQYDIFGHSAGGQVAHRFFYFKPNARVNRVVASSSGWFTMPDYNIDYPYGLGETPVLEETLKFLFQRSLTIMVGASDTDPNSANLRHTPEADEQGENRYQRAVYFYNESQKKATEYGVSYRWQFKSIPNVDHDFAATAANAVAILY